MSQVNSEDKALYAVEGNREKGDQLIAQALEILAQRFERNDVLTRPLETANYIKLKLADREHEVFGLINLDNRNRVIADHEIFRGTIDGASVYPREIVKQVLADNAAAVILYHNHPSGVAEPSQADIRITERLKSALALVDVRLLDHVIVGGADHICLSEKGLV